MMWVHWATNALPEWAARGRLHIAMTANSVIESSTSHVSQ